MDINTLAVHFPIRLTQYLLEQNTDKLEEIRLYSNKNCAVVLNGKLIKTPLVTTGEDMEKILNSMFRGSMYAHQTTLCHGFFTIDGGHRVGVFGTACVTDGRIEHMRDITAVCIRISREIIGAANKLLPYLMWDDKVYNTLIVSPPGCGKTTYLRDIARIIGEAKKVCIIDERGEIANCFGAAPNNVGSFTSVLSFAPKGAGITMALRTMSPDVIITDETGTEEEEKAIYDTINCGVKIITSAHGYSERDIIKHRIFGKLIGSRVFERIIVLSKSKGPGTVERIIADGQVLRHG